MERTLIFERSLYLDIPTQRLLDEITYILEPKFLIIDENNMLVITIEIENEQELFFAGSLFGKHILKVREDLNK